LREMKPDPMPEARAARGAAPTRARSSRGKRLQVRSMQDSILCAGILPYFLMPIPYFRARVWLQGMGIRG